MIPPGLIRNGYALMRSECCKGDIEMGLNEYDPIKFQTEEEREAHKKAYHREYDRRYKARKKAARLLAQSSGDKKTTTP